MDTLGPSAPPSQPSDEPSAATELASEIRHSALLLGGSLGLMSAVALVLLLVTTRLGS